MQGMMQEMADTAKKHGMERQKLQEQITAPKLIA